MLDNRDDIIYNKNYIVVVPSASESLYEGFKYTFKNTVLMKADVKSTEQTLKLLQDSNFKRIILVDHALEYKKILFKYKLANEIDFIYTGSLGGLAKPNEYEAFKSVIENHKKISNSKLAVLDEGLYETIKDKYKNVYLLKLDIEEASSKSQPTNSIGILNEPLNSCHSYYNELSALTMINNVKAKILGKEKIVKIFNKTFNIKSETVKNMNDLISNNLVNLYVNFTNNNNQIILKSIDNEVPCIVGNTTLFDNYKFLKEHIVVRSDDDVNEIAEKIEYIKENRNKVLLELKKFRKDYKQLSKKSVKEFLPEIEEEKTKKKEDKPLISVIVPVYNTEKYIENSLKSIIAAAIDDMEILVINDGSKDNSEEIILKYQERYPEMIRYIKQDNHGLGNVRNVGLKESKGKYLAAVDSDDTIHPQFFRSAQKYLEQDIDIVIYNWLTINNGQEYQTPAIDPIHNNKNVYKGLLYTSIMPSTCNKILKKELFNGLTYHEDKYEDLSVTPFVMLRADTIKYIDKQYYRYFIRNNSIMRTNPGNSMIDVIKIIDNKLQNDEYKTKIDLNEMRFHTYTWRIEEFVINPLYELNDKDMIESIKYLYSNIGDILDEIFDGKYYKEMLDKLVDKNKKEYIIKRNEAYRKRQLEKFIKQEKEEKSYIKITSYDVVHGNNDGKFD